MKRLLEMKGTLLIILIWIVFFLVSMTTNITSQLGGKGITVIDGEYYRIFTGALLHNKLKMINIHNGEKNEKKLDE